MTAKPKAIARWHQLVAARDLSGLDDLLADEVIFQSPAVHTPQVGKAVTRRFKVMVRPFKALQALIPLMAKQLER